MATLPILGVFLLLTVYADAHKWPTTMSNTCLVTNGCSRLPSKRCQMSDSTFQSMIVGKVYAALYFINGHGDATADTQFQLTFKYTSLPGNMFELQDAFRETPDAPGCVLVVRQRPMTLVTNRKSRAIYDVDIDFGGNIGVQNSRVYYVSRCPSEYLIIFICMDRSTISGNRCNGQFLVKVAVPTSTQDPPNTVNWYKIELELRKCLGLRLSDSRSIFVKQGKECMFQG